MINSSCEVGANRKAERLSRERMFQDSKAAFLRMALTCVESAPEA